jgi:thymidylate synthase (FAD)
MSQYSRFVLDRGKVELINWMGDDLFIVQAAQSSFGKLSSSYGERERKILRSLIREEHGVPFEHTVLSYRIKMPIFVARQLVKHRISSWSEHSGRYSAMEPEFYVPSTIRTQVGKPMEYQYQDADENLANYARDRVSRSNHAAWDEYLDLMAVGVAKEQARLVLPTTLYTTITWTLNVRSLLNVLHLRNDPHAQAETREYAQAMELLAENVIPDTLVAFNQNGRKAP